MNMARPKPRQLELGEEDRGFMIGIIRRGFSPVQEVSRARDPDSELDESVAGSIPDPTHTWSGPTWTLLIVDYLDAGKAFPVAGNLNTHTMSSLHGALPATRARSLASRLEIHYTPERGSWHNIAAIEFSAFARQCLSRRFLDIEIRNHERCQNHASAPIPRALASAGCERVESGTLAS